MPIAAVIIFWKRAGSIYALLERLWRLTAGKSEVLDKELNEFIKDVRDLEKFQFMFGLKVESKKELHKLLVWMKKYEIAASTAQAAKKWIDVKTLEIVSAPPKKYINLRVAGMGLGAVLMMGFMQISVSQFALLQMKTSETWFLADNKAIKGFSKDWVIEKNGCQGNVDQMASTSGFTKNEVTSICDAWKDNSLNKVVSETVKAQKIFGDAMIVGMMLYIIFLAFQMRGAEAAFRIIKAIENTTKPIAENNDEQTGTRHPKPSKDVNDER